MFLRALRRRWVAIAIALPVVAAVIGVSIWLARHPSARREAPAARKPQAPPDLAKLRDTFTSGVDAVHQSDGDAAVRYLSSFDFGDRAVEEYRLYYLANGYQLAGRPHDARKTLAHLWGRNPKLVPGDDAGFNLAALHQSAGDWIDAAIVYAGLGRRSDSPAVAAAARGQEIGARVAAGDIAGAVDAAKAIVTKSPRSAQAGDAIAFLRAVWALGDDDPLHLGPEERLERAASLLRDGDPASALAELDALAAVAPGSLELHVQLQRGAALFQLRRFEDSNRVLEPLTSKAYDLAVPALYTLSKSYRILSASINPTVTKTIVEKKKAGTVKVRVGKGKKARTVKKPRIVTTHRTVKLVDLAKKAKKDEYDRLATERLKDLLLLPLSKAMKLEVLNTLIGVAESKNQDAYEQELVVQVVKLDPPSDPGLQHFWDKAWAAYARGDFATAKPLLQFIGATYTNPNVKRQAAYWYARSVDREGQKEEAAAIYQRLAAAPYKDIYALNSIARGARGNDDRTNPLNAKGPDWREIADREMPQELRLAYELTALSDMRDARIEIQKNMSAENDKYAQALLADLYNSADQPVLMYRAVRRAYPQLATAEQDSAPRYFLRMYYPAKYEDTIKKYAQKNGIDPYLVMGLILQESYYTTNAKSAVGATGLMQLMPSTAKELAGKLHVPFAQSRLENPTVNIELGTAHLKGLINMFNGNATLAVASYNAGQGNVMKWRRAAPGKPMDEFIESIPFPETRNYVKRVTMLRASYARLAP